MTRRHLRAVQAPAQGAHAELEIAVRFTSTSGLIARLHKPLNSFHWVGPGTLRFTSRGLIVTAKRSTWLGLRHAEHLITPAEIRDVHREANAVQVHLQGSHAYFRLWAADSASAARIVALLPTTRTIEFESAIREPDIVIAWRLPVVGLLVLLAIASVGVLAWMAEHRRLAVREPNAAGPSEAVVQSQPQAAAALAKPQAVAPDDDALLADQDLRVFGERIGVLSTEFQVAWDALQDGGFSQAKFADELDQWLRPQWDDLEARLRRKNAAQGSARERADHELMAVINNWQLALYAYADDLRKRRQVVKSFEYLSRADEHLHRAQQMQNTLERSPDPAISAPTAPR
jgi:hypothetical protein